MVIYCLVLAEERGEGAGGDAFLSEALCVNSAAAGEVSLLLSLSSLCTFHLFHV